MKPILWSLHFGGREVGLHTYGILIGVGCAVAIVLAYREGRRHLMDGGKILDLSFWMLVAGLIGSRIFYVLVNAGAFWRTCAGGTDDLTPRTFGAVLGDCTRALQIWEGGLVFYGGFLAAALTAYLFARRQRSWSFWELGDTFAPSLAIGHAFGRLGCFAAGCCFGKACATGARWCVSFGSDSVAFEELRSVSALPASSTLTPPLFPTQLYEAVGELMIFAILLAVRRRAPVRRPGTLVLMYAALYGVLRFTVEMFRGDFARRFLIQLDTPGLAHLLTLPAGEPVLLSTGQFVSLLTAVLAAVALVMRARSCAGTVIRAPAGLNVAGRSTRIAGVSSVAPWVATVSAAALICSCSHSAAPRSGVDASPDAGVAGAKGGSGGASGAGGARDGAAGAGGRAGSGGDTDAGAGVDAGARFAPGLGRCMLPPAASDADVGAAYARWKTDLVTSDGAGGFQRVRRPNSGSPFNSSNSEGIAYGMIIAVYMNDQSLFDNLWRYEQLWIQSDGLMNWEINPQGTAASGTGAATDGDEDMAFALVMADRRWGGRGALADTYLNLAKRQIDLIWSLEVDHGVGDVLAPGDQFGGSSIVNISYFAPAYYRIFGQVTGMTANWNRVVDSSYRVLQATLNSSNGNVDNGLVPAWSTTAGVPMAPPGKPTNHQLDSSRTPFRVAQDLCWFNAPQAQTYLAKISTFYAGIGATHLVDGYALDGRPMPTTGLALAAFVGPAGVGAMAAPVSPAVVRLRDDAYAAVASLGLLGDSLYYNESWTVLSLLMMTGRLADLTAPH